VYQFATHLTSTGTHVPYEITQCYLPPGKGDNTFSPLPKPIKAGIQLSNSGVNLDGLVIYRGDIPARRQSTTPVQSGFNVRVMNDATTMSNRPSRKRLVK